MKRVISFTFALVLLLAIAVPCFASAAPERTLPLVCDYADAFTDDEYEDLLAKSESITAQYPYEVAIVFVDDMMGYSEAMNLADDIYYYNGFGYGEDKDGILLLVCPSTRDYWFATHGAGQMMFNDRIESFKSNVRPYLSSEDWYTACDTYLSLAEGYLSEGPVKPSVPLIYIPVCLIGGFIVAFIPMLILKAQLKSVAKKVEADQYVNYNTVRLTASADNFVNTIVTRTKIESNSSSGGSGGSHTSSSGQSFGGGGGKF